MRALLLALPLLALPLLSPGLCRASTVFDAVRTDQWALATQLAAAEPDPLVAKLVLYYRLLAPHAGHAAEIAAFMARNPDWPQQALLSRRLQEALLVDDDQQAVLAICKTEPPRAVKSMLRCADAETQASAPDAASTARKAWRDGIITPAAEAAFMHRWGSQVTAEDQWLRFEHLARTGSPAPGGPSARQALRLSPAHRPAAEALLALQRDEVTGPTLFKALPAAAQAEPALVLELARWYRRAGQDHDAAAVWAGPGIAAEQAADAPEQTAFWRERNLLARRLLAANEPALAYAVARAPASNASARLDQTFLAGWLALRRLDDPKDALADFTALTTASGSAITQGRAWYWVGRAHEATGDPGPARAAYTQAAQWSTTYYGQLAAVALGDSPAALDARVRAARDPGWTGPEATAALGTECGRAAVLLAAFGEARRAKAFLGGMEGHANDRAGRALAARLALDLGLPDEAVAIARRAGTDGVMLPDAGWPQPVTPPDGPVAPAIALGLIRQESSFDVQAASPVGARGLMQLMPATAAVVARQLGLVPSVPALTADPAYNMRLGVSYLAGLVARFGALPLAIAGYNAGPKRVQDWLVGADGGTDHAPGTAAAMIDWIEAIPFDETRNYVQRVIENIVIYRAQLGVVAAHPVDVRRG